MKLRWDFWGTWQVQGHNERLLQGGGGGADSVRRDAARDVRERGEVAEGAAGAHGSEHSDNAGGEQGGLAAPEGGVDGGRAGICGEGEDVFHGNLGAGILQRREFLHGSAHADLPSGEQEDSGHRRRPHRPPQGTHH